jgi:hypothetical protein
MQEEERKKIKLDWLERRIIVSQIYGKHFIDETKNAFANNKYPGDENLISFPEHLAQCEECREYYEFFVGKTWQDCLIIDSYKKLSGGQSFFKPLAWHYYLPAYLIQCIYHRNFSSFHFIKPDYSEDFEDSGEAVEFWNRFKQPRIDALTSKQCRIIIDYLEITVKTEELVDEFNLKYTQKALIYWKENYQKALDKEQNLNK